MKIQIPERIHAKTFIDARAVGQQCSEAYFKVETKDEHTVPAPRQHNLIMIVNKYLCAALAGAAQQRRLRRTPPTPLRKKNALFISSMTNARELQ